MIYGVIDEKSLKLQIRYFKEENQEGLSKKEVLDFFACLKIMIDRISLSCFYFI